MATGGTIASVEGDDGLTPGIGASHLFSLVPRANEKVFLLKLMLDTSPEIFDWVVASGINGLAQEAFGMGGLHYIRRNLVDMLKMLADNDAIPSPPHSVCTKSPIFPYTRWAVPYSHPDMC